MRKRFPRILSCLSAFLSALTLVHSRSGQVNTLLWLPKLLAAAWTPLLAAAGGLGTLAGLARRDRKATWAGLFGMAVAGRHIARVTARHRGLEQAFGADWPSRIPAELGARMLPKRWTPIRKDPPHVPWQRDVAIGTHLETGDPLLADLWQPPQDVPRTGLAAIYLHGSAWHYGDKDLGTRIFFRHLAGQGHVIVDLAYTLAPKAQLHAMLADVKRAIAWIKAHAAEYGVHPERVVLMGGSAGGHLALLAAYAPHHPQLDPADVDVDTSVRAVVSFYGPPDLRALYDRLWTLPAYRGKTRLGQQSVAYLEQRSGFAFTSPTDVLPDLLGGTPDEVPELYRLGSPLTHVGPHCPPTLLLQGAHDFIGMTPDVRRLYHALRAAGVPSIYVEFPDTEHGFDLLEPRWSPAAQAATYDVERFLALVM